MFGSYLSQIKSKWCINYTVRKVSMSSFLWRSSRASWRIILVAYSHWFSIDRVSWFCSGQMRYVGCEGSSSDQCMQPGLYPSRIYIFPLQHAQHSLAPGYTLVSIILISAFNQLNNIPFTISWNRISPHLNWGHPLWKHSLQFPITNWKCFLEHLIIPLSNIW